MLDINTINERMTDIGISDIPLTWFYNFINNRTFSCKINNTISKSKYRLKHGVPQGSVLLPIIFAIFLTPSMNIITKYPNINYNLYADDIEIHAQTNSYNQLQNCLNELHLLLTSNNLLLNANKTELLNIKPTTMTTYTFPILSLDNNTLTPLTQSSILALNLMTNYVSTNI